MGEVSSRSHRVSTYADPAAKVHSMALVAVVEALAIGDDLVIEDDAPVAEVDGGDSAGGWGDDDIACDGGYSRAETMSDGEGVVQNHIPEVHDSDQTSVFAHILHVPGAGCMEREVDGCMESGGANMICASRGMEAEVAHHPTSWVSSEENASAVAEEPETEAMEGTGDSSIGSLVPVSSVHLGSCNVCSSCFRPLQWPEQTDWISHDDALFSPEQVSPTTKYCIKIHQKMKV